MKRQQQRRKSTINSNSNCSSDSRWLRCWLCLLPLLVLATLLQIRQLLRAGIQLNKRGPGNKSAEAPIISTSIGDAKGASEVPRPKRTTVKPVNLSSLEPDDPHLLDVIRRHFLRRPIEGRQSKEENYTAPQLRGQVGQVPVIDALLRKKNQGFFVEAGAFDGISISNTLFFEKKRKWSGLLVEGFPNTYKILEANPRDQSFLAPVCLSPGTRASVQEFDSGSIPGLLNRGMIRPSHLFEQTRPPVPTKGNLTSMIKVQCFPLYSLLLAVGHTEVDFFSLDVEGGEFPILRSIPFDKVTIHLFEIEIAWLNTVYNGTKAQLDAFMDSKGYDFLGDIVEGSGISLDGIYGRRASSFGKSTLKALGGKSTRAMAIDVMNKTRPWW